MVAVAVQEWHVLRIDHDRDLLDFPFLALLLFDNARLCYSVSVPQFRDKFDERIRGSNEGSNQKSAHFSA